ncbi:MAG: type II toxin-antitoxin system Rv0910 family toxin [Mycobacterium sp.]
MATVDVSVSSDLSPEKAWELASDLSRFDEWLTIFGGWKSPVPTQVEVGTSVSSAIKVKGFRNTIHWRVTRYDEPQAIELVGRGKPAVCIALRLCVKEVPGPTGDAANVASGSSDNVASGSSDNVASGSSDNVASGSVFQVIADLTGGLLNTRIGNLVAKVLESDVRRSVTNLAALR